MDGRFQLAEPIPGVHYQAFAIGLQAISRKGLTTAEELRHFQQQVRLFANKMDGEVKFPTAQPIFWQTPNPWTNCVREFDQTHCHSFGIAFQQRFWVQSYAWQ